MSGNKKKPPTKSNKKALKSSRPQPAASSDAAAAPSAPARTGAAARKGKKAAKPAASPDVAPAGGAAAEHDDEGTQVGAPLLVVLVASAGGLGAYIRFFEAMPPDSGMAFLLIPHLDPHRKSLMADVLSRHTRMPVQEVRDEERVTANRVHVIPPNRYVSCNSGVLRLDGPVERSGPHNVIDDGLRALAAGLQDQLVAIVLSGTGNAGASGIKDVKAHDGVVIVQEPETAEHREMPDSAIATGLADYVKAPEAMPRKSCSTMPPTALPAPGTARKPRSAPRCCCRYSLPFARRRVSISGATARACCAGACSGA